MTRKKNLHLVLDPGLGFVPAEQGEPGLGFGNFDSRSVWVLSPLPCCGLYRHL